MGIDLLTEHNRMRAFMDLKRVLASAPRKREPEEPTPLLTPWGESLDAENVLQEHPRPQFARESVRMLNGWWDKVTVVIWGAPQKLIFENESVRAEMEFARDAGVEFSACSSCANNLQLTDALKADGIEVIRWGQKLSLLLQNGRHVITI